MINREIIDFIHMNYLKKNWQLELDSLMISSVGYEVDIYQVSARNRKRVARLTSGPGHNEESLLMDDPLSGLLEQAAKLFYSPGVRKNRHEALGAAGTESALQAWIAQGAVLRRVLYDSDGRTETRTEYMMGYELYSYLQRQKRSRETKIEARSVEWSSRLQTALAALGLPIDTKPSAGPIAASDDPRYYRVLFGAFVKDVSEGLRKSATLHDITQVLQCGSEQWTDKKVMQYGDFIVALTEITAIQDQFDWKEIGARYYREIGGSKRFDAYKTAFTDALEERLGFPLQLIGLSSQGTITPIYFAGELTGIGGFQYPQGFLHATTDLTVFRTQFSTNCHHLWLVENRAVLTRMATEGDFLQSAHSLVIGLDGQLRSSHRKLIADVLGRSTQLKQILVWCDADQAGFIIAGHARVLLDAVPEIKAKWILPESDFAQWGFFKNEVHTWSSYEARMISRLKMKAVGEQEAEMGGMERWIQWLEA
ncbi:Toprim sub domain-containing protein [Paenibacillus konkukensis]|nr:Toprim sub domain-containing protein [Paenibacillus konkukensis]